MSEPDPNASDAEDPIESSIAALNTAIERVGSRLNALKRRMDAASEEVDAAHDTDEDRARLAADLDQSRAREAELDAAVETAAEAVEAALAELQALAGAEGGGR